LHRVWGLGCWVAPQPRQLHTLFSAGTSCLHCTSGGAPHVVALHTWRHHTTRSSQSLLRRDALGCSSQGGCQWRKEHRFMCFLRLGGMAIPWLDNRQELYRGKTFRQSTLRPTQALCTFFAI
jgi:hypothetical protein